MRYRAMLFASVVAGCSLLPASAQVNITNFLTGLVNKVTADLQTAAKVAAAATPVDQPGVDCANALLEVQSDINKVVQASVGGGVITGAEVASLFQPGSVQANGERDKLVKGCSVKVAQVSGAIAGTTGWFAQLATMFAIPVPVP